MHFSAPINPRKINNYYFLMILGKDAPLGPSCVKASAVTATSAVISWLPSNSNFQVYFSFSIKELLNILLVFKEIKNDISATNIIFC